MGRVKTTDHRRTLRRTGAGIVAALAAVTLSSCALLSGPTPDTPERPTTPVPEVAPEFVPDGSAEDNLPYFTEVIRTFAAGTEEVRGQQVSTAVMNAGFSKDAIQVSFDETKTDLVADAIYVSVRIDESCLLGQVMTEDRTFVTRVDAALGPNNDICLIGQTRLIDW